MTATLQLPPRETAALARFSRLVHEAYGDRLVRMVLFGSHARGDAGSDSDVDVAVVLDQVEDRAAERGRMADLAYAVIADTAIEIQAWPLSEREWSDPAAHRNPALIRAIRRDGQILEALGDRGTARQGAAIG